MRKRESHNKQYKEVKVLSLVAYHLSTTYTQSHLYCNIDSVCRESLLCTLLSDLSKCQASVAQEVYLAIISCQVVIAMLNPSTLLRYWQTTDTN